MLRLLACCTLAVVGVVASCAGDERKKVVSESAGEGGETAFAAAGAGSSSLGGGSATGGDGAEALGAGQSNGGNQGAGAPGAGGSLSGGAGATSSDAGGQGGATSSDVGGQGVGGAGGDSGTQISKCGAGKYDAGEGFCDTCVAPASVQIACSAYNSILASSSSGNLLYARLTPPVAFFEPFPAALVVTTPTASFATSVAFNPSNGSWFVELDAGPDAPSEFTVPSFATTGACGHTYASTQPIHFERTGPDTYTHSCP